MHISKFVWTAAVLLCYALQTVIRWPRSQKAALLSARLIKEESAWTYKRDKVKSPLILALSSISISKFASSDSFSPSWSLSSLYQQTLAISNETLRHQQQNGAPTPFSSFGFM